MMWPAGRLLRQIRAARLPEIVPEPPALGAAAQRQAQEAETEKNGKTFAHMASVADPSRWRERPFGLHRALLRDARRFVRRPI